MKEIAFGHIESVPVGTCFKTYADMNAIGLHRQTNAGISGREGEGVDSLVVSGGYEDDQDLGDVIVYTGQGGQNASGKQVKDQELRRGNLALVKNQLGGIPVRVIRGAHKGSAYAPDSGYRYDGLYSVESHWHEIGKSGFKIWRYRLVRIGETSLVAQRKDEPAQSLLSGGNQNPIRKAATVERIVRDARQAKKVKEHYGYECQVCGVAIKTNAGYYAEAAHIKPLGSPHNGSDTPENLLCLCPNHHKMLDMGSMAINDDLTLIGVEGNLSVKQGHNISLEALKYHREHFLDL